MSLNSIYMVNRRAFLKSAAATSLVSVTGVSGCIGQFGEQPYGDGELQFLMSPSEPQEDMEAQYEPVKTQLEENVDVDVNLKYGANYTAIMQSLGNGTDDVAEMGPLAAAMGVMDDKLDIILQRKAYGTWDYFSVIVTQEDSGIESLTDLEGKSIAFADMLSASGSLYPLYMLKEAGLNIGNAPENAEGADFDATWSGHAEAITALQEGQVDAAGVGKFIAVDGGNEQEDPYKEGIVEVDAYDGIPRAPIAVSPDLSDSEADEVAQAFLDAPEKMYWGADGEQDADDEENPDDLWFSDVRESSVDTYQPVVDVAEELGLDIAMLDEAEE